MSSGLGEVADGNNKHGSRNRQRLKRRKVRVERHKAKKDPEAQPAYRKYRGYMT